MKSSTKKIVYRIVKGVWLTLGSFIALWTIYWYVKIYTIGELGGVLAGTILFASGIYMLGIFIGITLLFLLFKLIVGKLIK